MSNSISRLAFHLCILAASCSLTAVYAAYAVLPEWVAAPPSDTPAILWGVGEGGDLDAARRSALKDVAAKLRVAITAQVESGVTQRAGSVDHYARTRMLEEVQRTEFKNHKLEKSEFLGKGYYVLVSVDRRSFIADMEQNLSAAEQEIAVRVAGAENGSAIEKFVARQKALRWMEMAVASAHLLSAADPGFDRRRLANHEAEMSKTKSAAGELIFDIKADKDSLDVVNTLRTFLNESGIRTGNGGAALVVASAVMRDTIFGSHTVQLRVNLSVLDSQKRNLASREFVARGASVTDHQMARQAALRNLGEKLREAGPLQALGFDVE